jgi:cell division protein FtsB|tara:strand:- start:240 stop:530 length:291 start_codon:yes stop_codon:yes gene_type:complete
MSIRSFFVLFFFAGIVCYFSYHMISGGRGMLAYLKLSSEISSVQSELELVRMERLDIEHSANLLKSESLDLDLLEEQAKRILGYAKPREIVLIDTE